VVAVPPRSGRAETRPHASGARLRARQKFGWVTVRYKLVGFVPHSAGIRECDGKDVGCLRCLGCRMQWLRRTCSMPQQKRVLTARERCLVPPGR